jgi:hypothetical protein
LVGIALLVFPLGYLGNRRHRRLYTRSSWDLRTSVDRQLHHRNLRLYIQSGQLPFQRGILGRVRTRWTAVRSVDVFTTPRVLWAAKARVASLGTRNAVRGSLAERVATVVWVSFLQMLHWS